MDVFSHGTESPEGEESCKGPCHPGHKESGVIVFQAEHVFQEDLHGLPMMLIIIGKGGVIDGYGEDVSPFFTYAEGAVHPVPVWPSFGKMMDEDVEDDIELILPNEL